MTAHLGLPIGMLKSLITPLLKGRLSVFKFPAKMHICVQIVEIVTIGFRGSRAAGARAKIKVL